MDISTIRKKRKALEAHCHEIEIQKLQSTPKLRGHIKCNRCHNVMVGDICLTAGCTSARCYIDLYWDGKKHRFFKYYEDNKVFNYERAVKQLREMNTAIEKNTFNPRDWTIQAVTEIRLSYQANLWLDIKEDEAKAGEKSYETTSHYKGYIKRFFIPCLGQLDVRKIKYEDLERFKDELRKVKGIKTRRNIMKALHSFFVWMRRRGTIGELPVFPTIEGDNSVERIALDYDTQQKGLANIPTEHRDVLEFGMETGLRGGELTALKVGDIDMINQKALIQRAFSGSQLRETTKGKKKSWIPLSDHAFEIAKRNCRGKLPSAFVFVNPFTGKHYTRARLNKIWRKHSGCSCDFYSASRHSFCTQIIESGANPFDVQELMRHADIKTTRKYYHPTTEKQRNIVNMRGKKPVVRLLPEPKEAK